jgi:hypothetical protein
MSITPLSGVLYYSAIFKIKLNFAKRVRGISKRSADAFHRAPGWPLWGYCASAAEVPFYSPNDLVTLHPIKPPDVNLYVVRPHFDFCQQFLPLSLERKRDRHGCSHSRNGRATARLCLKVPTETRLVILAPGQNHLLLQRTEKLAALAREAGAELTKRAPWSKPF